MNGDFVKLVEDFNGDFIAHEDEGAKESLSQEEQTFLFRGWLLGKMADDTDYSNNQTVDVVEDFKDDVVSFYSEESISLDEYEFTEIIKSTKEKLSDEEPDPNVADDEDGDDEVVAPIEEPTEDDELVAPEQDDEEEENV